MLQVELHGTAAGERKFDASSEHRVRVHAGAPVRGTCRNERFLYTRGDLDVVPAGWSDHWQEEDVGVFILLRLPPFLLQRAAEEMEIASPGAVLEPRCQLRDPQIEHIAWALDAEQRAGRPGGALYAESLGMALAVRLLGRHAGPTLQSRRSASTLLARATDYVEAHLDEDLSIARLAAVAGMSASHLKALFRRSTGLPVHRYVVTRRVERARVLLRRGNLPASQVALQSGFAHQSHMAHWMRRMLGVTPASVAARLRL